MGFPELKIRRFEPLKNEIYNLGVVPDLQISKKVVFLRIEVCVFLIFLCIFFYFGDQHLMQNGLGVFGRG